MWSRGDLKITDNTKWIRSISRCSQRQVNCREVIWHWNVARAPSTFETESSFLWLPPCAQKFSYRDHTGAGELMCWVRRVCQWRSVQNVPTIKISVLLFLAGSGIIISISIIINSIIPECSWLVSMMVMMKLMMLISAGNRHSQHRQLASVRETKERRSAQHHSTNC